MNIIVLGAGAIGSLFGAYLAQTNSVVLIGRPAHVDAIQKKGLTIHGKTQMHLNIPAVSSLEKNTPSPDLLLVTVKSYDTIAAMQQARSTLKKHTLILSLQNGLDNIEKIKKSIPMATVFAGITTHGAFFTKPGVITHTGKGSTIIGVLNDHQTKHVQTIIDTFNTAGLKTTKSTNILQDLWMKAIINSSINPLTAFFQCKNGYLLKNPILNHMVEKICTESTSIAKAEGISLSSIKMLEQTQEVIHHTAENSSSMLQSIQQRKPTEIASINGKIVETGRKHKVDTSLNMILLRLVETVSKQY
jgi:2-dehydropantoate 2-reductase